MVLKVFVNIEVKENYPAANENLQFKYFIIFISLLVSFSSNADAAEPLILQETQSRRTYKLKKNSQPMTLLGDETKMDWQIEGSRDNLGHR